MVDTDVTVYRKINEELSLYDKNFSIASEIGEDIHEMKMEADDLRALIFGAGGDSHKIIRELEYHAPAEQRSNGSFYQFGPLKQYFEERYSEIKSICPDYEDVIEEEVKKPIKPTYNLNNAITEIDEVIDNLPKHIQQYWDETVQAIEVSMAKGTE